MSSVVLDAPNIFGKNRRSEQYKNETNVSFKSNLPIGRCISRIRSNASKIKCNLDKINYMHILPPPIYFFFCNLTSFSLSLSRTVCAAFECVYFCKLFRCCSKTILTESHQTINSHAIYCIPYTRTHTHVHRLDDKIHCTHAGREHSRSLGVIISHY